MSTDASEGGEVSWPQLVFGLLLAAFSGFSLIVAAITSVMRSACDAGAKAAYVSPLSPNAFLWLPVFFFFCSGLAALWIIPRTRVLAVGAAFLIWGLLYSGGLGSQFVAH